VKIFFDEERWKDGKLEEIVTEDLGRLIASARGEILDTWRHL
jgi:hypothetical protein